MIHAVSQFSMIKQGQGGKYLYSLSSGFWHFIIFVCTEGNYIYSYLFSMSFSVVAHFSVEEEAWFTLRYENGYDLKHDTRYNQWLELHHPETVKTQAGVCWLYGNNFFVEIYA